MWPSSALYWHMGASWRVIVSYVFMHNIGEELHTPRRFWKVTPRTVRGLNSLGMGFPLVWGSRAVPAGGLWAGVKYEMPSAGLTETSGQVILMVFRYVYYYMCEWFHFTGVGPSYILISSGEVWFIIENFRYELLSDSGGEQITKYPRNSISRSFNHMVPFVRAAKW